MTIKRTLNRWSRVSADYLGKAGPAIFLFVVLAAVFGWVLNIIKLAMMVGDDAVVISTVVIRLLGVPLAFLGAVVGWF